MNRLLIAVTAVSLATPLSAQTPTRTVPKGYLKAEGASSHHPCWYYTNGRAMYVYQPDATGFSGPTVIRGLRRRGNGTSSSGVAWSGDFEILISSQSVGKSADITAWSANHGKDVTVFMKRKKMSVPGWTGTASPRAWDLDFKGDRPFVTKGKEIAIDVKAWTPSTQRHNNYADAARVSPYGTSTIVGAGCPTNFYAYSTGMYVGVNRPGAWYSYAYSRSAKDLHFAFAGIQKLSVAVGSFGSAPCTLYVAPLIVQLPKVTNEATGYAYFTWATEAIMANPALAGLRLRIQHGAIDAATKGLKLSRAVDVEVGPGLGGGSGFYTVYNYASGSTSFDPDKDKPRFSISGTAVIFGLY